MPVAVGAIHAARKKKQAELAKKKEKLAKQRAADDEAASKAYAQIDTSSVGSIDRDQMRQLLAAVTGQAEIDEDGLEMVVKAARKAAAASGLTERPDAPLPRDAVLGSVRKYRLYLREKKKVDELVRRWDIDGNGTLDRNELRKLLLNKEKTLKSKREAGGIIVDIEPDDADIDWILQECDANNDGVIGRAELLPALATWATIAEQKVETAQTSSACALL